MNSKHAISKSTKVGTEVQYDPAQEHKTKRKKEKNQVKITRGRSCSGVKVLNCSSKAFGCSANNLEHKSLYGTKVYAVTAHRASITKGMLYREDPPPFFLSLSNKFWHPFPAYSSCVKRPPPSIQFLQGKNNKPGMKKKCFLVSYSKL